MYDRDQNRTVEIGRLELKCKRARELGQHDIVERYTDQAERIRARLGTGPTLKPRKHRTAMLGINGHDSVTTIPGDSANEPVAMAMPLDPPQASQPMELDGQERMPGYGI